MKLSRSQALVKFISLTVALELPLNLSNNLNLIPTQLPLIYYYHQSSKISGHHVGKSFVNGF